MKKLSLKEKATNADTMDHILMVQKYTNKIAMELIERGRKHDRSKLENPEVEYFSQYTDKLKDLTYGSEEYMACLEEMKPAIEHHYCNNRHHPNHFENGIEGMNLIDINEMLCDWVASSKRQHNGNLRHSLEESCKRFNVPKELQSIFKNTIDMLEDGKE